MLAQVSEVAYGCGFQHFTFPYRHFTPHSLHSKIDYRKMDSTNTFSSVHLLASHTKGAFPSECSSLYGSRFPLRAETSFQDHSGSCFFASSHAESPSTFHIYLSSFYCIFSSGWITHWSLDLHRILTSSQNTLFPLKSYFVKRLYLTQQVCSLHAFKALSAEISDKNKFLLSFISTNCGFHIVGTERKSVLPQRSPLSHHHWNEGVSQVLLMAWAGACSESSGCISRDGS